MRYCMHVYTLANFPAKNVDVGYCVNLAPNFSSLKQCKPFLKQYTFDYRLEESRKDEVKIKLTLLSDEAKATNERKKNKNPKERKRQSIRPRGSLFLAFFVECLRDPLVLGQVSWGSFVSFTQSIPSFAKYRGNEPLFLSFIVSPFSSVVLALAASFSTLFPDISDIIFILSSRKYTLSLKCLQ